MKCYLHIGTPKTGTTTIQDFFFNNRKKLPAAGFYYPESLGLSNKILLAAAAASSFKENEFGEELRIKTADAFTELQKKTISRFNEELKTLPPGTKIICSSEQIHAWLTSEEEIEKLKQILQEAGIHDITVIVYLRNPSETANSLCSTAIKTGTTADFQVPEPSYHYFEKICNHKKTVERFSKVFGKEKIVVRLFRKDKFKNNLLIHDISDIIGLDINKHELTLPQNQNESLSLLGLILLKNLNEKIKSFYAAETDNQRNDLLKFITTHFSKPGFVMPREMFEAYDAYFADSNEWIRQNYFPEEQVLFPYKIPEASRVDISENELKNITDFITDIWFSRSTILNDKWYRFGRKTKKQKLNSLLKNSFKRN